MLTAVAQATERVTLGTAVLMPAYRHPVHAAVTLGSLDLLSEGRLVVGVGAGFPGFSEKELELVGVDFHTRFSRLDDTVALWRELWTGDPESFHGRVLRYDWLPEVPAPARPGGPPIWLGGMTPAALGRTARIYDGWLPYPPDPADYATALATIRDTATRSVTPALFATLFVDDDPQRGAKALDDYCRATYRLPLEAVGQIQTMLTGPDIPAQIGRFVEAGVQHIMLRLGTLDPATYTEQLAALAEMLPALPRR